MTNLPIISGRKLIRLLEQLGFHVSRIQGSHHLLRHPDGRRTAVPVHGNRDIAPVLLAKILRQVELSPEEYPRLASQ